ncbi:MAG TPA: hypothetical protein VFJ52_01530, partial [Terriglobia bacterium]|nr:hypothetical protein [Terriglobia bacterium]
MKDLLGPRKTVEASQPPKPAESAAEKTSPVGASASTAVVSATPEPVAAVSPPVQRPREQTGRSVRSLLSPIHFGGNVYLFQYVPLGIAGARPKFELYAFSALVDGQKGPWGFHADYRFRTTKLRSFFPGNTWLQQGYVRYRTDYGEFNAGSFYRRVGLDWDDSFFGNIEYFD